MMKKEQKFNKEGKESELLNQEQIEYIINNEKNCSVGSFAEISSQNSN